jgi:two-component system OmpR family response regulator/two-component system copper resistance phosphate regulon response regulator CusR
MNIAIAEDDQVIGKALSKGLIEAGHQCLWFKDGPNASEGLQSKVFDIILLDLMLPGTPGLQILKKFRTAGNRTPVILVTALGSIEERVEGLNAGADDYLVKPFAIPELLARIDAVCRRTAQRPTTVQQLGDLTLDLSTRRVHRGEQEIDLTPTEFSLLELMMRHAGQVVTRKMLCEHLWEYDWEGTTNVIEVHINRLRNKLDKLFPDPIIQTVRGRGYALRPTP